MEKKRIIITVEGGLIQDVCIPDGSNCVVEVRDYDIDGTFPTEKDEDGGEYVKSEWE